MADINNPALHKVYLSLGSNIGNRRGLIRQAVELLESRVGHVSALSSLHETEPWGFESPNKFLNACCCCLTTMPPRQVLLATQRIERDLGRTGKSVDGVYHDRVIDIVDEPGLKIPHPLMYERDFVMEPLKEIMEHV